MESLRFGDELPSGTSFSQQPAKGSLSLNTARMERATLYVPPDFCPHNLSCDGDRAWDMQLAVELGQRTRPNAINEMF